MKLYKIFAVALAALTMTACSDDDDLNTAGDVTVSLEGSTLAVNEDQEYFDIPVMVSGKPNGPVKVTIEVEAPVASDDKTAVENTHFIVTDYTINIPAGEAVGNFEVRSIWEPGVVNPDRSFTVKIKDVQGAKVGSISTAVVTIVNIDNTFTALFGKWKLEATNHKTGDPVSYNLTFRAPSSPEEEEVGHLINAAGLYNDPDFYMPIWFDINPDNGEVLDVYIPMDFMTSDYVWNFGIPVGEGKGLCVSASIKNNAWVNSGVIQGSINEDNTEITFDDSMPFVTRIVAYPSFQYTGYSYGAQLTGIKLTR